MPYNLSIHQQNPNLPNLPHNNLTPFFNHLTPNLINPLHSTRQSYCFKLKVNRNEQTINCFWGLGTNLNY